MPYIVYKLIHFFGIAAIVAALAASAMHVAAGGTRATNPYRRPLAVTHGIASFLILLGGFGMLARLGIMHGGLPGWIWAKLAIWIVVSAALVAVYRGSRFARLVLVALPLLVVLSAAVALYKPF
jgi:hypothetical protein